MIGGASARATETNADLRGFAEVDSADDPDSLIRSLDTGRSVAGMRAAGRDILDRLRLAAAEHVLDVGCGTGADALAMADRLPPHGRVVGLDLSRTMVDEARRRHGGNGERVTFTVGSALDMPFPDGHFDRCRAQTVLQHVPDAERVIQEIARVVRPGGRVASFEFDLGLTIVDHPDRRTTRKILDGVVDASLQGWLGRALPRLYRRAGFTDVEFVPHVVFNEYAFFASVLRRPLAQLVRDGVLPGREAVRWMAQLHQRHLEGDFMAGSTALLLTATRA